MMNEPVSSIMSTDLVTLMPNDSLHTAEGIFRKWRIHHLPVVDGTKLVGLITTFDLFKLGVAKEKYADIKVKDIMTTKLAKLNPNSKVGTAAEIFLENLFHAVPIVDEEANLLGIVTTFDVLKYEFRKAYPNHVFRRDKA